MSDTARAPRRPAPAGATTRGRRRAAVALLLLAAAGPLFADAWYEHYARAQEARSHERWAEAVAQLEQAIERRGDSAARARTYGMKVTAYFPYLELGVAYHHLGRHDAALQAFDTEERLGEVGKVPEAAGELQRYRQLALAAREQAAAAAREQVGDIAAASLAEARRLEQAGRFDDAIAALGRGLAVAPQAPELLAALERLQVLVAQRQRDADRRALVERLREEGRAHLEAGRLEQAAGALQQALALADGREPETQRLLAQAQERLRRAAAAAPAAERAQRVAGGLAEARRLQAAGDVAAALEALQGVLALEPGNRDALALQAALLRESAAAAGEEALRGAAAAQLAAAEEAFGRGEAGRALALVHRVLALEPTNPRALELARGAYRRMNRELLGGGAPENLPPAISFLDGRDDLGDGSRVERVDAPAFQLSGLVIDESPVRVAFYAGDRPIPGDVRGESRGDQHLTHFRVRRELAAGATTIRVVATDAEGLGAASDYEVLYRLPWHRRPELLALAGAALLAPVGVVAWRRRARRRRLLQVRFNPYIAGAPVLDAERFFGREALLQRVVQTLPNNSVLLYGERRIGKTSFQHQLKRRLQELDDPRYRFFPVYVDLQGVTQGQFFATLAEEVVHELGPLLGAAVGRPQDRGEGYGYHELVRDLRAAIAALQGQTTKKVRLVLQIDEVDELNDYDPRINQRLRSLFMKSFAENLVAVVSGVQIKKHWEREGSPWYNFFEEIEVTALPATAARELVEKPIAGVFDVEPGVAERVVEITGGRPYLIQKLCLALVNRLHEQGRRRLTLADVEAAWAPEEAA